MKCPYPDCQHESPDALFKAGETCCCPRCRRLSLTCGLRKCRAQNRLFTRFCRRCKEPIYLVTGRSDALRQWESAARFLPDWYFRHGSNQAVTDSGSNPPNDAVAELLDLVSLDGFDATADVVLEMTFVDGLLALHQGGGALAVLQPFGQRGQPNATPVVAWSMPETEMVPRPALRESKAATYRPFTPVTSHNRRHLLFSTPYAVLALDLWNLPGWATGKKVPNCRHIFQSLEEAGPRLAAQPVPFGGPTDAFGLLLRTQDDQYLWKVVELAGKDSRSTSSTDFLKDAVELKYFQGDQEKRIEGSPCQIAVVEDVLLALATPRGHWIWPRADAINGNTKTILQTRFPATQYEEFGLDKHVKDRSALRFPRHVITVDRDETGTAQTLTWFYPLLQDNSMEWYSVNIPNRQVTRTRKSTGYPMAEPLGRRTDTHLPEMLFRLADRCLRLSFGQDDLHSIGELHLLTGQVAGFEYHAPMLISVFLDPRTPKLWQVDLLSVSSRLSAQTGQVKAPARGANDPHLPARLDPRRLTFEKIGLIAMPLIWSHWMFTLERREREGREPQLMLVRRDLPIQSVDAADEPQLEHPVPDKTQPTGEPVIKW